MSVNENNDKERPPDADPEACYEQLAREEEIYLEETEEEVTAVLISYEVSPSQNNCSANPGDQDLEWELASPSEPDGDPSVAESLDDQLIRAAEELITGDADDPPLSETAVNDMVKTALNARILDSTGFAT